MSNKLTKDMEQILEEVKENCVGYFYGANDNFASFGPEENQKLFPWEYIHELQPLTRFQAWKNKLNAYRIFRGGIIGSRESKKFSDWEEKNLGNVIVYHVPFSLMQLLDKYDKDTALEWDLPNYKTETRQHFAARKEYVKGIAESFDQPFFLHHRNHVPPKYTRSYTQEFLVVGTKKYTQKLSNLILNNPKLMPQIISKLTGAYAERGYEAKEKLIHFDPTNKPKKQVKNI
jgi:hypothetical protein